MSQSQTSHLSENIYASSKRRCAQADKKHRKSLPPCVSASATSFAASSISPATSKESPFYTPIISSNCKHCNPYSDTNTSFSSGALKKYVFDETGVSISLKKYSAESLGGHVAPAVSTAPLNSGSCSPASTKQLRTKVSPFFCTVSSNCDQSTNGATAATFSSAKRCLTANLRPNAGSLFNVDKQDSNGSVNKVVNFSPHVTKFNSDDNSENSPTYHTFSNLKQPEDVEAEKRSADRAAEGKYTSTHMQ